MPVRIRPLEADDYDSWLPLWKGYLDFYEVSVPDEVTAETWRRLIDPDGRHSASAPSWTAGSSVSSITSSTR